MQEPHRKTAGAKKHCCFGTCRSDSRYNSNNLFYFLPFPKPCKSFRQGIITGGIKTHCKQCPTCCKADLWVQLCNQKISPRKQSLRSISDITKDTYIYSLQHHNTPCELSITMGPPVVEWIVYPLATRRARVRYWTCRELVPLYGKAWGPL